jgi:hypothetical protein
MADPIITILAVLVLGVSLIAFVWAVFRVLPPVGRLVARTFWCPFRARRVTAEFTEKAWDGTLDGVSRCSAFMPSTAVTCDKLCLKQVAAGEGSHEVDVWPSSSK